MTTGSSIDKTLFSASNMATALPNENINITINYNLITCQICTERFDSPRILPCQHTFCKKCIVTIIQKNCLGQHESNTFHCPACRRQCRIGKGRGRKDMDAIMKAFPENRLMNELLDGIEKDKALPKKAAFTSEVEDENNIRVPKKVIPYLWNYLYFLRVFKEYMIHLDFLSIWIGREQALLDAHVNRKFTAVSSTVLRKAVITNSDDLSSHTTSTSAGVALSEIETVENEINQQGQFVLDDFNFLKDMNESAWIDMHTMKVDMSLLSIVYGSLGFSNLFSLTSLIVHTFLTLKIWPVPFSFVGVVKQSQIVFFGILKVIGSLFFTQICGLPKWWSVMFTVTFIFIAYLILWVFRRKPSLSCVRLQFFDVFTKEKVYGIAVRFYGFSFLSKLVHATVYVENVIRFLFILYALFKMTYVFEMLPILMYIAHDIVTEIIMCCFPFEIFVSKMIVRNNI